MLEDVCATPRANLVRIVEGLLQTDSLVVQMAETVWQALHAFDTGKADFADYLIERLGTAAGCSETITFDKAAAPIPGMRHPS